MFRLGVVWLLGNMALLAAEYRGVVQANGLPIPGASVTAKAGEQSQTTYTDEAGAFVFPDLAEGTWELRVEMIGFTAVTQPLRAGANAVALTLAPRAVAAAPRGTAARRGFEQLAVNANANQAPFPDEPRMEAAPDAAGQNANESFLVNGSLSRGLQDAAREDPFLMGGPGRPGGPGGPGGGGGFAGCGGPGMGRPGMRPGMAGGRGPGGGGGGGFGQGRPGVGPGGRGGFVFGNRANRREAIRGQASLSWLNSALDAKPYSISGQEIRKPSYAQTRFGISLGGALRIPKLFAGDKTFFFLDYRANRGRNPFDSIATLGLDWIRRMSCCNRSRWRGLAAGRGAAVYEADAEPWATPMAWAERRGHSQLPQCCMRGRYPHRRHAPDPGAAPRDAGVGPNKG